MDSDHTIAIVGMAGVFPGASTLDQFWQNILNKVDATRDIPADRWIIPLDEAYSPALLPDKAISRRACLINGFQPDLAGLSLDHDFVAALDPLHHLVLHAGRDAYHSCRTVDTDPARTGIILAAIALPTDSASALSRAVFSHAIESDLFGRHSAPAPLLPPHVGHASKVTGFPAALLAQGLGLGGVTYTLDAACASSLYAVKLACDELQALRTDMMIAGGVSRPDCLYTQIGFSQLQALSPTGRCAPFDASADGLVVGEGVGLVVLKRLADALRDKDTVYGVVRGIGLANDIGGNLLAPDSEGQVRAMQAAYAAAGWKPQDVDLIEGHGAGTPVGDATELRSLSKLWPQTGWKAGQCGLGSVKSMIGHLLTAAGAAGLIKTLLALNANILPPSLKFSQPPDNSPLRNGPWRVLTEPEPWTPRKQGQPLRAAVSAFGFGGINAHLLVEKWEPEFHDPSSGAVVSDGPAVSLHTEPRPTVSQNRRDSTGSSIAVVGMGAFLGGLKSLRALQEAIFTGRSTIHTRPGKRWYGIDATAAQFLDINTISGGYIETLNVRVGEFHLPPNEIPDIIPQHLLMLQVAAQAMADAGQPVRERRPRTGVVVGIDFDFEATNFSVRWNLYNKVQQWRQALGLTASEAQAWLETLKASGGPALTATRTLGALGGVIASRIAKEFLLGGPSFVVSNAEASGLKALGIGMRSLQQNETDCMLIGAVDFTGDVRRMIAAHAERPYTLDGEIRPFDERAGGTLPGEGAVAVVLKRLQQARDDGDRIYAVIKSIGHASQANSKTEPSDGNAYVRSMATTCAEAGVSPEMIDYIETHGSGDPQEDALEARSLARVWADAPPAKSGPTALGSLTPTIGLAGAASGLAKVVKAGLCLHHEIIPPLLNYRSSPTNLEQHAIFHVPVQAQYWFRDRCRGPRRACVSAITPDGACSHVLMEEFEYEAYAAIPPLVEQARRRPLGYSCFGLFVIAGDRPEELHSALDSLEQHLAHAHKTRRPMEAAARAWYQRDPVAPKKRLTLAITLKDFSGFASALQDARKALAAKPGHPSETLPNVSYTASPFGPESKVAFVFPGSGNHYLGMGTEAGIQWPEILRKLDFENQHLKSQHRPRCYVPQRVSWRPGWETEAYDQIIADPLNMIFGQVVHGVMMAGVVGKFGLKPDSVIGYSLGESAGLFASGAWSDRDAMLERMLATDLFTTRLSGPCLSARQAWRIASGEPFDWAVAVVSCSAAAVLSEIPKWPHVRLLIVNTPSECVLGGERRQVTAVIDALQTNAFFLDGVVTVHCDAALPIRNDYKNLHLFPVTPPAGVQFYSCAQAHVYAVTSDTAAASIEQQAMQGFNFPAIIAQAYRDGVRLFLEMGPQASCTRMIHTILKDRPHLALSACMRGENAYFSVLKLLGAMVAQHLPVDLASLYGPEAYPLDIDTPEQAILGDDPAAHAPAASRAIVIPVGGSRPAPKRPHPRQPVSGRTKGAAAIPPSEPKVSAHQAEHARTKAARDAMQALASTSEATAAAHREYIEFSSALTRSIADAFDLQNRLLQDFMQPRAGRPEMPGRPPASQAVGAVPVFGRDMCMEFAIGSVGRVLGPEFDIVDTYKARVRLPDEPLMLVDRILSVQGRKGALGPGRIVTEHDVNPDAWYLDGGRAPVCISVEAGQADLFLSSYLGIDHVVQGQRTYRLLDATVEFHRDLPCPGDILRYEIEIEKFVRQGQTHLFFFNFKGFIGDTPLLEMTNGCAGFFTEEEVRNSGGIILTAEDRTSEPGDKPADWRALAPMEVARYDDRAIAALRNGNLAEAFGPAFENKTLAKALRLPGGRMHLIDRILQLEPHGGRFGLGLARAEADIHPDDWFLTCHFMDDMVMPGTLMYECCAHTLRVFLQRMGWITTRADVHYGPVPGVRSVLKCRGPVTPATRHVVYEVEIKSIGYKPEPYVLADAHMFADGHRIVMFKDMSLQMNGITRDEIESIWTAQPTQGVPFQPDVFDRKRLREFCRGKPSRAFGDRYAPFDRERFIARLPSPPYAFIDRVSSIEPSPWVLKPGGWIEAAFDVNPEAWYFKANRTPCMPYCAINEIALQACGWLAAYVGSALRSALDLRFRNLGGTAVLKGDILPEKATLKTRTRLTQVSEAGNMIIEHFDFMVSRAGQTVYEGRTHFGFFTVEALAQQVGIRDVPAIRPSQDQTEIKKIVDQALPVARPMTPRDGTIDPAPASAMPAAALCMIDRVEIYVPDGGPHGLGYLRGLKTVDPQAWFFDAHFYQDPVCPGSLGLESLLQLLKFAALERWGHLATQMRFGLLTDVPHDWMYRGQVLPTNREITVEAVVTEAGDAANPFLKADGLLHVDGLCIYKMQNFGIKMVPLE